MSVKIFLDPGHGVNTPGKRSPDGRFWEYAYNRLISSGIVQHLIYRGYDAELLVPEPYDICLKERVRRINGICELYGKKNVLLVSVHVNTAGNESQWYSATGWSCYTTGGQTEGGYLANELYAAAKLHLPGRNIRKEHIDGGPDIENDFYLLINAKCAACLTKNGFINSEISLKFLESELGKRAVVALHVEGILNYIKMQ